MPLLYATLTRERTAYASRLLDAYGPIVVIAPNQVHTNSDTAMKVIYNRSSIKTSFYAGMGSWKGVPSTLGMLDYASSAPSRNNLLQCFQNKNLAILVDNIASHIAEFIGLLRAKARAGEDVDGVVVFRLLALDIVTDVLWGETNTLLSQLDEGTPAFLRRFHAFSSWNALKAFIPAADPIVRWFGTKKWKQLRKDCEDMDVTAREALARWKENPESRHDRDVLSMLQAMNDAEDPRKRVPNDHIPAYMVEMLAAGSSTTSHTAAFTFDRLSINPEYLAKLHGELRATFPDASSMDETLMMDLPYLDAAIRETMRMFPMVPGPLERYLGEGVEVSGLRVPSGVIGSTGAFDQGRKPDVFPQPDQWRPERWFDATEEMRLNWIPFGHGSRACPGSNLAMTELKYMIGTILRYFSVVPPKYHTQDGIELGDVFTAGEKSGHLWLRFIETE